jgi:hypothetical protein
MAAGTSIRETQKSPPLCVAPIETPTSHRGEIKGLHPSGDHKSRAGEKSVIFPGTRPLAPCTSSLHTACCEVPDAD